MTCRSGVVDATAAPSISERSVMVPVTLAAVARPRYNALVFDPIRFTLEGAQYVLVTGESLEDRPRDFLPVNPWEARRAVRRALESPDARGRLRQGLNAGFGAGAWEDRGGFSRRVSALLGMEPERLVLLRRPSALRATILTEDPAEEAGDEEALQQEQDVAWFEVMVVDDDDEPCPNVGYEIELSDGRVRRGRTNDAGVIRYERIPDGQCTLKLVELDTEAWSVV
ncbi:MAG: hypothetical protein K0V04_39145 [Deltaproteobacteria bacterium]|nr:hypothetical protein [Deltaproteobacteria bacterium]